MISDGGVAARARVPAPNVGSGAGTGEAHAACKFEQAPIRVGNRSGSGRAI